LHHECIISHGIFRELKGSQQSIDEEHFRVTIDSAIKQILGMGAPSYTIETMDTRTLMFSLLVAESDMNLVWAALSIYGSQFGQTIAMHLRSIHTTAS
jgi:hypothetical protein